MKPERAPRREQKKGEEEEKIKEVISKIQGPEGLTLKLTTELLEKKWLFPDDLSYISHLQEREKREEISREDLQNEISKLLRLNAGIRKAIEKGLLPSEELLEEAQVLKKRALISEEEQKELQVSPLSEEEFEEELKKLAKKGEE